MQYSGPMDVGSGPLAPITGAPGRSTSDVKATAPPTGDPRSSWSRGRERRTETFLEFTGGRTVRVQLGLNGVRGMAVVPVVLYHLGYFKLVGGAQLVMSLFFTQSGFLITTLILQEYGTTGRFRLGEFWAARARRLLPPAWITLAVVGIIRSTTNILEISYKSDLIVMFFNVTNWFFVLTNQVAETFFAGRSSELNHTWSLSIEEQFYIVLALVAVLVIKYSTRPATAIRTFAIVGAAVSFALPFVFGWGHQRTFFGTDARAGELLVGVAMATVMISRDFRVRLLRQQNIIAALGAVALSVAIGLWHFLTPTTPFLQNGLLPFGTVLWVFVIVGTMMPDGPAAWLMQRRPLLWLGRLSYGIYMYHFPILAVFRYFMPETSLTRSLLIVAATLAISEVSYRYVEMPIRRRQFDGRPLAIGASAVLAVIAVTIVLS